MVRIVNLGSKALASNFMKLSEPYKVTFAVTYRCNSRCKTCNIWKKKPKKELKKNEIDKIFKKSNPPWLNITGGEVFLRENITELIEKSSPFFISITTNGILTENIIKNSLEIKKIPKKFVLTISLDGPREIHNKIRGVDCWDKAIETYKKSVENGIQTYIGFTISPYNIDYIEKTVDEIKKHVPDFKKQKMHLNFYHESGFYFDNIGKVKKNENYNKKLEHVIEKFIKSKKGLGPIPILERKFLKLIGKYIKRGESPLPCKALSSSCFIEPNGDVYPCINYNKKIGNLRDFDYDIKKIWNSKKANEIRKKITNKECPGCWTPCEAYQTILGNIVKVSNNGN